MPKPHSKRPSRRPPVTLVDDDTVARATDLLELSPEDALARVEEHERDAPGAGHALVQALGTIRTSASGGLLAALAAQAPDKALRKAARRELHRLRAVGIAVELPTPIEAAPVVGPPEATARVIDAHASAPDGIGSRALWIGAERPHGGLNAYVLLLNDVVGLKDCTFRDTTRKRYLERLRDWGGNLGHELVELPADYALSLVSEALALNAESGFAIPTEFQLHRRQLGELPPPPEAALIHRDVSRGQVLLLPDLLEQSAAILDEPEASGWFFGYDESMKWANELSRARESPILLAGQSAEQRAERAIAGAINELFTPTMRRALRRRLEETAYIFWKTGRQRAARQAVAAAFALSTGPLDRHPVVRAMVERSLEAALEAEHLGLPPALIRRTPYDPID